MAKRVLIALGLGDAISAMAVRPEAYVFRLHDTGEVISQFALAGEHLRLHRAPYNQLRRADFQQLLASKVHNVIRLNARVVGFEETPAERAQIYQRNRVERNTRIVEGSSGNRTLFHVRDQQALRRAFAKRDERASRNP